MTAIRRWPVALGLCMAGLAALLAGLAVSIPTTGQLFCLDWLPGALATGVGLVAVARWRARRVGAGEIGLIAGLVSAPPVLLCALAGSRPVGVEALVLAGLAGGVTLLAARLSTRRSVPGWGTVLLIAGAAALVPALLDREPVRAAGPVVPVLSALPLAGPAAAEPEASLAERVTARAPAWRALDARVPLRPIDSLSPETLRGARALLLAQPRLLAPEELVALDGWVRAGGRAVILADPLLLWPDRRPLGDAARPPLTSLLDPLLGHWGLRLAPAAEGREGGWVTRRLLSDGSLLILAGASRFEPSGPSANGCALTEGGFVATCALGSGRAVLLADADLLHDALWTARPEAPLAARDWTSDAVPLVVRLLAPQRVERPLSWVSGEGALRAALGWAAALVAVLASGAALANGFPKSSQPKEA